MSKFQKTLEAAKKGTITTQEIEFQVEDAREALDEKIRLLEKDKKGTLRTISTSIKPGYDASDWVEGILGATVKSKELEIKITILEGAKKEYFG